MPHHGKPGVPSFNKNLPWTLRQYFEELEGLFTRTGVTDDSAKKHYARLYVDAEEAELWSDFPEARPPISYLDFKHTILDMYLGSKDDVQWVYGDIARIRDEALAKGIQNEVDLANYYRNFTAASVFLVKVGKVRMTKLD
jgi:hypothetical protein